MKSRDRPTLARLIDISEEVKVGKAEPKDARSLLAYFCECIEQRKTIPEWMNEHFVKAFHAYLDGDKPIERALGLERKPGRPTANDRKKTLLATAFLRLRMEGLSFQNAQAEVSERLHASPTVVAEAWREKAEEAVQILRLVKADASAEWSPAEMERLMFIFENSHTKLDPTAAKPQRSTEKSLRKTRRNKRSE